jgi:hypothetical protein
MCAYNGMLENASFMLYFNQRKHVVIGKNQEILFSILAGYPETGLGLFTM